MDISALANSLTAALVPLLPYLLKAGEKAAEETGKAVAGQSWEWAKSLWTKLKPKVESNSEALAAAQYSREHRHALFSKNVGQIAPATSALV